MHKDEIINNKFTKKNYTLLSLMSYFFERTQLYDININNDSNNRNNNAEMI